MLDHNIDEVGAQCFTAFRPPVAPKVMQRWESGTAGADRPAWA
jgi:hypothetical protein